MLVKTREQLSKMTVAELKAHAKENGLKGYSALRKADLVEFISFNINTFGQPIVYIFNDHLNMHSITNLDYMNLSIQEMTNLLKQHCAKVPFSNQVMNEKELKACYRAGFRARGHETLSEKETIQLWIDSNKTINMTANTTEYNIIKTAPAPEAETETEKVEDVVFETFENVSTAETVKVDNENNSLEAYTVGNRVFSDYNAAIEYCNSNDYDPDLMIVSNDSIKADTLHSKQQETEQQQPKNNLYWYEYRLRGFSLGCQPDGFIEYKADIGKYGIIGYNRQLTDQELNDYELIPYEAVEAQQTA